MAAKLLSNLSYEWTSIELEMDLGIVAGVPFDYVPPPAYQYPLLIVRQHHAPNLADDRIWAHMFTRSPISPFSYERPETIRCPVCHGQSMALLLGRTVDPTLLSACTCGLYEKNIILPKGKKNRRNRLIERIGYSTIRRPLKIISTKPKSIKRNALRDGLIKEAMRMLTDINVWDNWHPNWWRDNREDETNRLVFADWCWDNDYPLQGEGLRAEKYELWRPKQSPIQHESPHVI